jgi:hypothetical protein
VRDLLLAQAGIQGFVEELLLEDDIRVKVLDEG